MNSNILNYEIHPNSKYKQCMVWQGVDMPDKKHREFKSDMKEQNILLYLK